MSLCLLSVKLSPAPALTVFFLFTTLGDANQFSSVTLYKIIVSGSPVLIPSHGGVV